MGGGGGGVGEVEMRTVYLGNLHPSVDEATVRGLFSHCGEVTRVKFGGDMERRYGFVEFVNGACAQKAILMNGLSLGDRALCVSLSRSPTIGGGRNYANANPYGGGGGY